MPRTGILFVCSHEFTTQHSVNWTLFTVSGWPDSFHLKIRWTSENSGSYLPEILRSKHRLNSRKSLFCQPEVDYLGWTITPHGLKINNWPRPKNLKELHTWLGSINYFRKKIKNISATAWPLYKLTTQDAPFEWQEEQENTLLALKEMLTSDLILAYTDVIDLKNQPFIIEIDASVHGIAGILMQKDKTGIERVISYQARSTT